MILSISIVYYHQVFLMEWRIGRALFIEYLYRFEWLCQYEPTQSAKSALEFKRLWSCVPTSWTVSQKNFKHVFHTFFLQSTLPMSKDRRGGVTLDTSMGNIKIELYWDHAPKQVLFKQIAYLLTHFRTCRNFYELVMKEGNLISI